jgi:hypothetical protein
VDKKQITIAGLTAAALGGGGGWASYDRLKDHAIEEGSKVWVTLASQNIQYRHDIEDELAVIQRRISAGTQTNGDMIRKAVLEERLRQLEK